VLVGLVGCEEIGISAFCRDDDMCVCVLEAQTTRDSFENRFQRWSFLWAVYWFLIKFDLLSLIGSVINYVTIIDMCRLVGGGLFVWVIWGLLEQF
jgi:hypothetical protein